MPLEETLSKIVAWQKRRVSNRELMLVLAFIVGFLASVAAYVLHIIMGKLSRSSLRVFV